jgi:DHA1 family tetracycline resistance protein-like MFS transporter
MLFKKISPVPILLLVVFLDFIGFGMIIPIAPLLLTDPTSSGFLLASSSPNTGYILLGIMLAMFPLGQFLAAPVLGQLSDRIGRKPVLTFTLAGTLLSYIIFAIGIYTRNIPLLIGARFVDGITGSNISVTYAALADITKPEERSRRFGLIGATIGLGLTLGPFLGGALSDASTVSWFDFATPFWFAAGLSLVAVVVVLTSFPETLPQKVATGKIRLNQSVANIRKALAVTGLRPILSTSFLYSFGFTFYQTFVGVFLVHKFGFGASQIGNFFLYTGIWLMIAQLLIVRRLARLLSERQILRFSLICTGLCPILYLLPSVWWGVLFIVPFFVIFNSLTVVNIPALVSRSAEATMQGEVLGINASIQALGQTLPPIFAGLLAAQIIFWAPLLVSGSIILVAGFVFIIFYKEKNLQHA